MRKILPYILFALCALGVLFITTAIAYGCALGFCAIASIVPTAGLKILSVIIGTFAAVLFIVEEA